MTPRERRRLVALLLLHLLGAIGFAAAAEYQLGEDLAGVRAPPLPRDPSGQRLYILMVDSLNLADLDEMPNMRAIGDAGFRMGVQPCFDNFTAACTREMLTGRKAFSLFSMLENFSVTQPGVGPNLFGDARAAGLQTAMLSWGDLHTWSNRVDTDRRLVKGEKREEARLGLELAASHDVVFHHWIWYDVASHHKSRGKRGAARMAKSRAKADAVVGQIAAGLPADMGLIVTGDHGHAPDGRHVQGMDVPTALVARSPNLVQMRVEGRPPSAAVRAVAAAITGLASPASQVEDAWRDWMAPSLGPTVRSAGVAGGVGGEWAFPIAPLAAAMFVSVLGLALLGWRAGLAVALWAAGLGWLLPWWLELSLTGGFRRVVEPVLTSLPIVGALGMAAARSRHGRAAAGLVEGAALGSVALLLVVTPSFGYTGALYHSTMMVVVPLVAVALVALPRAVRSRPPTPAAWLPVGLPIVATGLLVWVTSLQTNNFRIQEFPTLWPADPTSVGSVVLAASLGLLVHRLADRDWRAAPLGAAAVLIGMILPDRAFIVAFAALGGALAMRDGVWRSRSVSALILLITSYSLAPQRQIGALWTVLVLGLSVEAVRQATLRMAANDAARVGRRALTVVLVVAGLWGLVWTTRLQIASVDFTFAVDWLPGRLHKRLWWVVLSTTLANTVLPIILVVEIVRARMGAVGLASTALAGRVALLRFGASIAFLAAWIVAAGEQAATIRLRSFLQDAMVWLFIGSVLLLLAASARAPRARDASPATPGPAEPPQGVAEG